MTGVILDQICKYYAFFVDCRGKKMRREKSHSNGDNPAAGLSLSFCSLKA
jgi:hypothetical protein